MNGVRSDLHHIYIPSHQLCVAVPLDICIVSTWHLLGHMVVGFEV